MKRQRLLAKHAGFVRYYSKTCRARAQNRGLEQSVIDAMLARQKSNGWPGGWYCYC